MHAGWSVAKSLYPARCWSNLRPQFRAYFMIALTQTTSRSLAVPGLGSAVAILVALTVVRLIGLKFSTVDLFFDEAQYWAWSREPAFGYFSKPPLLAWIIAIADHVCGSSEACIRSPAPILYFGTSMLVYAVARLLYDVQIAFFSALSVALALGAVFSARIISTDVPLLFCWALALLAYVKLVRGAGMRWAVVLGIALGFGLMAKYAMIYFVLGAALAAWLEQDARRLLYTPAPWLALLIAAVIVAPNILWNFNNDLATFKHTGGNIQGSGVALNPFNGLEFFGAQFLVFGPIVFAVLLATIVQIALPTITRADRLMLAFAIPPLALVTALAFVTRALANWAAPAFVSAVIVVVAILIRRGAWRWLAASLALGVMAQMALLAGDAMATRIHVPTPSGGSDPYHRTLGWRVLGERAGELARRSGARAIVGDARDDEASLVYYWRDQPEQVLAWQRGPYPDHQFELSRPLTQAAPLPLLFVSRCAGTGRLAAQFSSVEALGHFDAPTGPTTKRTYFAFKLDGPRGPIGPLGGCR
jgi:Dolichyl-phosphate-mannose-protein mannosyltransferase